MKRCCSPNIGRRATAIVVPPLRLWIFICPDDAGFPNWLKAAFPAISRDDAYPAVPRRAGARWLGRARSAAGGGGALDGARGDAGDGGVDRPRRPRGRSDRPPVRPVRRRNQGRARRAGRPDRRRGPLAAEGPRAPLSRPRVAEAV